MKNNNKGFSLVELIVVIAIMAILAAVAVVGFSMYIPKAQQANDKQLISDIEYAMTLAGYNGDFVVGDSGYIILVAEGEPVVADGDKIIAVMEATYGSDWKKEVDLQYDGWTIDTKVLNAGKHEFAGAVNDSSYIANIGTDKLLGDVQNCTTKLAALMSNLGSNWAGDAGAEALNNLIPGVNDLLAEGGYSGDKITAVVLANATVFGIAGTIDDEESANITNNFNGGYYLLRNNPSIADAYGYEPITTDSIVDVAHTYAALEALVGYVNDPTLTGYFSTIDMNGDATSIVNNISAAGDNIVKYAMDENSDPAVVKKICEYYGVDSISDVAGNTSTSSPAAQDGKAYTAIMQTVNDMKLDYANDLGTAGLFTTGDIDDRVNSFVTVASLSAAMGSEKYAELCRLAENVEGSAIIISYVTDGTSVALHVLPIEAN